MAIGFEEAYEKAKELKPSINSCTEYEDAFVFGCSDDDLKDGGYGIGPCVIMKETGKAVTMPYYVVTGSAEEVGEIKLQQKS